MLDTQLRLLADSPALLTAVVALFGLFVGLPRTERSSFSTGYSRVSPLPPKIWTASLVMKWLASLA